MSQSNQPVGSPDEGEVIGRPHAAYKRLLSEIDAVPAPLTPVTLDVPTVVTTSLGVLPELKPFEAELKALPGFNVSAFDKLEDYTLALSHAHAEYLGTSAPPEVLSELVNEATRVRTVLMADLEALVAHEIIPAERAAEVPKSLGYRGVAYDITRLIVIFRQYWEGVENNSALTRARLGEYEILSDRLITAVGVREQSSETVDAATVRRQRAFTLVVDAYDDVRRGLSYLRWKEGDLDTIMPSLYSGRVSRKKQEASPPPTGAPAPGTPAASSPAGIPPAASASGAQEPPVPIGLPGSNPFSP